MRSIRLFLLSIFLLFLLSACAQPPAPATATLSPTHTQTPSPTLTATIHPPGHTPVPTHNLAPAATITPQPNAACPPVDSNAVLDTSGFDRLEAITLEVGIGQWIDRDTAAYDDLQAAFTDVQQNIIDFLNRGGDVIRLQNLLAQEKGEEDPRHYVEVKVADVTGDKDPEVFILMAVPATWHEDMGYQTPDDGSWLTEDGQHINLTVIGCQGEHYERLAWFKGKHGSLVMPNILDLNADGIAEIIQPSYSTPMLTTWLDLEILAWDGEDFTQQVPEAGLYVTPWYFSWEAWISDQHVTGSNGGFEFADIDGNGTIEVLILGGSFSACAIGTRRGDIILQWTGHNYSGYLLRTPPEFRIQAVRDGDHMTASGFFDEALAFYDRVLNDATLKTWSPDYVDFNRIKCSSSPTEPFSQNPTLDEQEYDRLAAYALYRLMLLHFAIDEPEIAQSYYDRLVREYASSVNVAYVDLASTFWEAYAKSGELNSACEAARTYADEHKESILLPLGSYYDADLARRYAANDICPFGVVPGA